MLIHPPRRRPLPLADYRDGTLLFVLTWLVYFAAQLGRLNYSVALTGILDTGFLTKSVAGLIGTSYYICYGCGQLISGFLGDRCNCFVLLFLGLTGSAAANVWMSLAPDFATMLIAWGVNGLAQSLLWTPLLSLYATVMPEQQRAKACVNIATTTPIGMLACYLLSNWALGTLGWKPVFWVASIPMFAIAAILALGSLRLSRRLRYADAPQTLPAAEAAHTPRQNSHSLGALILMSGVLFMMLPIAIQSVLKDGMTTWTPAMLTETFSVEPTFAVTLTTLLPIPNLLGGYLGTWIDRKWIKNELKTAVLFFSISLGCLVLMFFVSSVNIVLTVAALAVIVMSMHAVNMMIITFVPVRFGSFGRTGTVSGILNATAYMGGAVSTYGIGVFAERIGWANTILLWVGLCAAAVVMCALLIPRWHRFRETAGADRPE